MIVWKTSDGYFKLLSNGCMELNNNLLVPENLILLKKIVEKFQWLIAQNMDVADMHENNLEMEQLAPGDRVLLVYSNTAISARVVRMEPFTVKVTGDTFMPNVNNENFIGVVKRKGK